MLDKGGAGGSDGRTDDSPHDDSPHDEGDDDGGGGGDDDDDGDSPRGDSDDTASGCSPLSFSFGCC